MNIKIKASYTWVADCQFDFNQVFLIIGDCYDYCGVTYQLTKTKVVADGLSRDQMVLVQIN